MVKLPSDKKAYSYSPGTVTEAVKGNLDPKFVLKVDKKRFFIYISWD